MNSENFKVPFDSDGFLDWDALEDVDFAPEAENNTPEENKNEKQNQKQEASAEKNEFEKNKEFALKHYGDKLGFFAKNLYDSGRRDDYDSYTMSAHADVEVVPGVSIMPWGIQSRLIVATINSNPIPENIIEEVTDNIATTLSESELAEEIKNDPFLRSRRVKYETGGGYNEMVKEIGDKNLALAQTIWELDEGFERSGAAAAIFISPEWREKKYHGAEIAQSYTDEQGQFVESVIDRIVNRNPKMLGELLRDPFLREKYCERLVERAYGEKSDIPDDEIDDIKAVWYSDNNFYESKEFKASLADAKTLHPDIYTKVDDKAVEKEVNDALNKIPDEEIKAIMHEYLKNPDYADSLLINALCPVLGLDNNPPGIRYEAESEDSSTQGCYERSSHSVVIYRDVMERTGRNRDRALTVQSAQKPENILSRLGKLLTRPKVDENILNRLNLIAHETWHAHQWAGRNIDKRQRALYRINFFFYADHNDDYKGYRTQLLEKEAWAFGDSFEKRCRKIAGLKQPQSLRDGLKDEDIIQLS
jgi:hypothetical protein